MPPVARLMIPEPRYVSTTPSAMPAISAPEPSPRRLNSRICCTVYVPGSVTDVVRCRSPGSRRRLQPSRGLDERMLALVQEELRPVVADARRRRVLAALQGGCSESYRARERLGLGQDRLRGDLAVADFVEEPGGGQDLAEGDD